MRKLTKEEIESTWTGFPKANLMDALMDKMLEVNAEEAKDAARYRWLSHGKNATRVRNHVLGDHLCAGFGTLDAAIDAAMKGTP
jgi:hypothetical protein